MTDLSALTTSVRTIEIKHPVTDALLGVRLDLRPTDDDVMQKLQRQFFNQRQKAAQKNKAQTSEEIEANVETMFFTATLGWEWYNPTGSEGDEGYDPDAMPKFGDAVPTFNRKNFVEVIRKLPWFKAQIGEELEDTKAFFTASGSN